MSFYIFVLAMSVFSGLLEDSARQSDFKFHNKCENTNLSHVCFADDLMVFLTIKEELNHFECLSGLTPNPSKSNFLFYLFSAIMKEFSL